MTDPFAPLRALEQELRQRSQSQMHENEFLVSPGFDLQWAADKLAACLAALDGVARATTHGPFPCCPTCELPIDSAGFCSLNCKMGDAVMMPCTCTQCAALPAQESDLREPVEDVVRCLRADGFQDHADVVQSLFAHYVAALAAIGREQEPWEQRARELLWKNHGCPVTLLYGDDGEMQCGNSARHRVWDFKRTPWAELSAAMLEMMLKEFSAPPARPADTTKS